MGTYSKVCITLSLLYYIAMRRKIKNAALRGMSIGNYGRKPTNMHEATSYCRPPGGIYDPSKVEPIIGPKI